MLTFISRFHSVVFSAFLIVSGSVNAQWVTTIAGKVSGYQDGIGDSASFNYPINVESDNNGNLYVSDFKNHRIRKINLANNQVITIAGSKGGYKDTIGIYARFDGPRGMAYDAIGNNLFITDAGNSAIRKIDLSNNQVTTFAGGIFGYADGIGANARFWAPYDIEFDSNGDLYVTDGANHRIRKIDTASRYVSTFAGNQLHGDDDGIGTNARFWFPAGITYYNNRLYIAGYYNHIIRRINIANANVTTISGITGGFRDGPMSNAKFRSPFGIVSDNNGNLFVSDQINNRIRKIDLKSKVVTTIAGSGQIGYLDDTTALEARFNEQRGIDIDDQGNIYIADWRNHRIRKLTCGSADVSITASSTEICPGEPVQLKAKGADTYQWENGLGTDSVVTAVPASDTTYYVSGVDSLNCTAVDSIMITMKEVPDKPIISMFNSTLIISSIDTTIEAYQWLDCDNGMAPIPNATHSVFTPGTMGSYAVQVMRDSCTNTSDCFTLTGISEHAARNITTTVHPNPNNGNFSITTGVTGQAVVSVYNTLGILIHEESMEFTGGNQVIEMEDVLPVGVYVLVVSGMNGTGHQRFVVKR